jgi:hypothetical protein
LRVCLSACIWKWISYTPEDGHVGRNSENQHNKAARRRKHNLQYPLT